MLDFPRWKVWATTLLCLLGIALAVPTFVPESMVAKWPTWLPSARVNLGLDLAGGSHLLLEADTSDFAKQASRARCRHDPVGSVERSLDRNTNSRPPARLSSGARS